MKKMVLPYMKRVKSLLVLDSFSVHIDASLRFAVFASENNTNLAVILMDAPEGSASCCFCKQTSQRCGTPPVD